MEALDLENSRYMDDILIFALTRWKLRKAVRVMNQVFNELKPEPHPDKILIWKTVRNFKKHIDRLYEQGADLSRIGQYVKKWAQWAKASGLCPEIRFTMRGRPPAPLGIRTQLTVYHYFISPTARP